jgi:tRNA-Thr(GGU) m(6)t(6)A37 methyltransferase TsaA
MSEKMVTQGGTYQVYPIGYVRRYDDGIQVEILEPFRPALKQLDHFSHVIVLWWVDQLDDEDMRSIMQAEPPYAEGIMTGVFACRSPCRPNPIALTTCEILGIDEAAGIVRIANIDAYDGTPILDLKAYAPVCDRVREVSMPEWLSDWPEWMPEEGIGLET